MGHGWASCRRRVPEALQRLYPAGEPFESLTELRTWVNICVFPAYFRYGGNLNSRYFMFFCISWQFAPIDLRQHIREHNLFGCAVDIRQAKLIPVGNDASTCPNVLPRGVWTMDPPWAMQVGWDRHGHAREDNDLAVSRPQCRTSFLDTRKSVIVRKNPLHLRLSPFCHHDLV